ncbi:MAG: GNAT family N-acetyltransferase, partial [Acidimicrobiales bacterium]
MDDRDTTPEPGLFLRLLEPLHRTVRSLSDEVIPLARGWVLRTRSLPSVWSFNALHITQPASMAEVLALADEYQGDLAYRHIVIEDEDTGSELEQPLHGAGWRVDREVYMVLADPPTGDLEVSDIRELTEEQTLVLTRRWCEEDHPGISAESLDQLLEFARREGRLWDEARFGIVDAAGNPMSMTKLRIDDSTAWVEDVYTVPTARCRGYAKTLVTHATTLAAQAKREVAFIIADDNDWPKH